jgi:peptidyl-prolyl isomerase E (cyclophilin E)
MDYAKGVHRGFGFVEYEEADDASEAIFNMDGADLLGRSIKVSMAQPNQLNKLSGNSNHQAIWSSDEWFQQQVAGNLSPEEQERLAEQGQDQQVLRDEQQRQKA